MKYAIIVALGAISYGALSSFAKIAYGQGYTPAEVTFTQALLGTLILWSLTFFQKVTKGNIRIQFSWKLVLAGTTIGLSAYCFYLSVKFIPISLAIVLLMQVSWMSNLGEWIFFRKKMQVVDIICTLVIIVGTILAGNLLQTQQLHFSLVGIGLALAAAFIYTLYVLFVSKLGKDIPMLNKSALMMTGSSLVIFLINAPSIVQSTHFDVQLFHWGIFLALFGTVIPPICFTAGMPKIGPGLGAILLTLELPAVVLCAHFILGEEVSPLQIVGMILMMGAIIYLNLYKQRVQQQLSKPCLHSNL
ncbi:threonine/homoserine efflux transporter RhtA [Chitinophaga skermanii]|uniref:Threonine/homoserine efflux transporter RhtA n=1 Tax=Chitinophaga skermanii TaxID=331697 RepID=A0A327QWH0_9BACT|nr:DMT family transporter [Chitinophaga skermanii]RAJ08238.1 threonine/homoserine efflux transporter RhtA [Chitinophaga skermanii]